MPNYIVTYNISEDEHRELFEELLTTLGLQKQSSNQSTFYGFAGKNFIYDLFSRTLSLNFGKTDTITVYYPKLTAHKADIEKFELKKEGRFLLSQP